MARGIIILIFMIIMMALMVSRKIPTLISLIILALGISLIGGVPLEGDEGIINFVFRDGAIKLSKNIMIAIIASWLGSVMGHTGITKTMIKKGAELGGDKIMVVHIVLYLVCAVLFSVCNGLGGAVMIGTIMIPILIAVGVEKTVAAGTMLFAYGTGDTISLSTTTNYSTITGAEYQTVYGYSLTLAVALAIAAVIFIIVNDKKNGRKFAFSAPVSDDGDEDESFFETKGLLGGLSMLTPAIPVILVAVIKWDVIPALFVGVIFAVLMTCWKAGWSRTMNMLVNTFHEGFRNQAPAATLMIVIGILLNAINSPAVEDALLPFMNVVVPQTPVIFAIFFIALAPLCLYRGPLNLWGMGAGLAAVITGLGLLSPQVVMVGFVTVAIMQVVCCPTNTHNVWATGFVGVDVTGMTKKLIIYMWPVVALMVIIGTVRFF